MSNLIPISVIAVGGVLAVAGTFWLAVNNMKSGREAKTATAKLLDTAQDAAARMGNDKTRDELIEARTRLLSQTRLDSDKSIKEIIDQLPALADEYIKLNKNKAQTVEAMAADFKLCWGPLVKFTLEEFDRRVDELRKEVGAEADSLKVTTANDFDLTALNLPAPQPNTIDGGNLAAHPTVRTVSFGNVTLIVTYSRAVIRANSVEAASLTFAIRGSGDSPAAGIRENPFRLRMDANEGSIAPNEKFEKPKDGIPAQEIIKRIRAKITATLERLMVIERATRAG